MNVKILAFLLLATIVGWVTYAYAVVTNAGAYYSAGAGQYAVNINSATTLTVPAGSGVAQICIESQAARYRDDGTNPTATTGIPVAVGCFQYFGPLNKVAFIGQVAGSTLDVSYYKSSN